MEQDTLAAATAHALADYPHEACGLVIVEKGRERYLPCVNTAETASEHFRLSAEDYAAAEDRGTITALFHSHPNTNAEASEADLTSCEASGLVWFIASVIKDGEEVAVRDIRRIAPSGYSAPLVGRSFTHGVLDCYTLIRDWYWQERQILLPNFPRDDEWWKKGENLYMDLFGEAGFVKVADGTLEVGDVILMQILSPVANHAAVYLGDEKILHHLYGRLSTIDIYGGSWADYTRAIVRYQGTAHDNANA